MSDYDIHSCGYYCDRHACIVAQRNELRDKLFEGQLVKTYSGGKPNYTQPIEPEPMIDGWPLYSGLPQPEPEPVAYINVTDRTLEWAKPTRWETPTVVKMDKVPLYTAPPKKDEPVIDKSMAKRIATQLGWEPKREWVGLTDMEKFEIQNLKWWDWEDTFDLDGYTRAIEAKLKEKNT